MDKESKNMARSEHNVTRRGFVGAAAATAATVAGLGLAGCGGGGETTTDSGSASTDSNVEIIEADEEGFVVRAEKTDGKAPKNECILAFEGEFQEMHPMDWSDGNSGNVVYYIYDSLYDLDENYEPVPRAAESYEVSDDACTYTFRLREGITFTDGAALNADAVVSNYQAAIDPANNWRRRRTFIETIDETTEIPRVDSCTAVDELTVQFHLPEPYAPFMNSMTQFYLISPNVVNDSSFDYSKQSAGSGPYMLEEYAQGDHVSIVRNEDYWGEAPSIDRIDFRVVPEAGSRIAALQTGEATAIYPMPTDQVATVRSAGDINIDLDPVDDHALRHAQHQLRAAVRRPRAPGPELRLRPGGVLPRHVLRRRHPRDLGPARDRPGLQGPDPLRGGPRQGQEPARGGRLR